MSLLLDALKKAAEEKERLEQSESVTEPLADTAIEKSESLESSPQTQGLQMQELLSRPRQEESDDGVSTDAANADAADDEEGELEEFSFDFIEDDDDLAEQTAAPSPTQDDVDKPVTISHGPVSFELVDEDEESFAEFNDSAVEVSDAASLPSGFELLEEDESEQFSLSTDASHNATEEIEVADEEGLDSGLAIASEPVGTTPIDVPTTVEKESVLADSVEVEDEDVTESLLVTAADETSEFDQAEPLTNPAQPALPKQAKSISPSAEPANSATSEPLKNTDNRTQSVADRPSQPDLAIQATPRTEQLSPGMNALSTEPRQSSLIAESAPTKQSAEQQAAPDLVLSALKKRKRQRSFVSVLLVLLVVTAGAGWGYLMFLEQQLEREQQLARYPTPRQVVTPAPVEPAIASSDEQKIAELEQQILALTRMVDGVVETEVIELPQATESLVSAEETAIAEASEADLTSQTESKTDTTTAEPESVAELDNTGEASEPVEEDVQFNSQPLVAAPVIEVSKRSSQPTILATKSSGQLDIARRGSQSDEMKAYDQFKQGNYQRARILYEKALATNPVSRDAVMGLAAVATVRGDIQRAEYYYQQLLEYNPTDRQALEGWVNLPSSTADPIERESRLQQYLQTNPNSAKAQAALGRVLASQQRWHEAQQAFFTALTLDTRNAKYAHNVAVALDHMSKYRLAKRYYQQALEFSASTPATVLNQASIRKRLLVLSQLGN